VKRGEIWLVSGNDYAGKPRPAIILQGDAFPAITSVTICPLTSDPSVAPVARVRIEPSADNGLKTPSFAMADKVTTVPLNKVRNRIGEVSTDDMSRIDRTVLIFLGLAAP
jgi:mRNA interferase MazF